MTQEVEWVLLWISGPTLKGGSALDSQVGWWVLSKWGAHCGEFNSRA